MHRAIVIPEGSNDGCVFGCDELWCRVCVDVVGIEGDFVVELERACKFGLFTLMKVERALTCKDEFGIGMDVASFKGNIPLWKMKRENRMRIKLKERKCARCERKMLRFVCLEM